MRINSILIQPIMTEKATKFANNDIYMFHVAEGANKYQIKETVEDLFKVKVSKITVTTRKGKMRKVGRRMTTKQLPNRKIAFITVKEGKIDLFPRA